MNAKTTIRRILFVAVWLCIGGGMLTLLLAAISSKRKGVCRDYTITLKGPKNNFFINEGDVEQLLTKAGKGAVKGQPVESFDLNEMERTLEKNTWISEAELYFDNRDVLHITVTEKEPVARLFTTAGNSFYIDNTGKRMPLSDKLSARVPVFTGFPDKKILNINDSALLKDVKTTAEYIINSPFWLSQVAQVDITADGKFEMVPVVGNHLVKLGDGEHIAAKFNRLMVFYRQVLSKTGLDKYKLIDVQYKGQVVASRYAGDPKIDSVQLRRNVEKLLRQSIEAVNDTVVKILPQIIKLESDSASVKNDALPNERTENNPEKQVNPNPGLGDPNPSASNHADGQAVRKPAKKEDRPKVVKQKTTVKKDPTPKPKAVMPKKPAEEENGGYN